MKGRHPFPPVFFATIRQLLPKRSAPPFLMHDSSFSESQSITALSVPFFMSCSLRTTSAVMSPYMPSLVGSVLQSNIATGRDMKKYVPYSTQNPACASFFLRSFIVYLLKCPTRSSFFDQRKLYAGAVTKSLPPFTSAFLIVSKKASSSSMCSRTSKMPAAGSEFFLKPPSSRVEHITFLRPRFIAFDAPCRPGSTRQTSAPER